MMMMPRHSCKAFCIDNIGPTICAATGEPQLVEEEEDALQPLLPFASSSSAKQSPPPEYPISASHHPCKLSESVCLSSRLSHDPSDTDCMHSNYIYRADQPHMHSYNHVHHAPSQEHTVSLHTHPSYSHMHPFEHEHKHVQDLGRHSHPHSHLHIPVRPHFNSCRHTQVENQPLCPLDGGVQHSFDQPMGAKGFGMMKAILNPQAIASPYSELWYDNMNICSKQAHGRVECIASPVNLSQDYDNVPRMVLATVNRPPQHCCSSQASSTIPQQQCCQIAAHESDTQKRVCFATPMAVNVTEKACANATMGSPIMHAVHEGACYLQRNSFDDASDRAFESKVSHAQVAQCDLSTDLVAHTRKLHSVWWQASEQEVHHTAHSQDADSWKPKKVNEQTAYECAKQKHVEHDGYWKETDVEKGPKPSDENGWNGSCRKQNQDTRQNCWKNRQLNKRRRVDFPKKSSCNARARDKPSSSNIDKMSEKPSFFLQDADGWGDCSIASNKNAGEPVISLYNQMWDENAGTQMKEDYFTMTCQSSYVGWTDSCLQTRKKEPASANPTENIDEGSKFNNASNTWLGAKAMNIEKEATVVMPGGNIQSSCPSEPKSTGDEHLGKLTNDNAQVSILTTEGGGKSALVPRMVNQAIDFLRSSSDDRELEDDLLYESDGSHCPMVGSLTEADGKSRENQAYEFFMQIFEENKELQKRYKGEYCAGEFDCLVCSNIPNKPIKRYNGLVSVVMHAKKILNTKRLLDHRGFARALCDFMGWDAHGNPITKPSENIQPRACILEPESIHEGDEKIVDDSKDQIVGDKDSISLERKDSQDGGAIEDVSRPFEGNITMLVECCINHGTIKEDNVVTDGKIHSLKSIICYDGNPVNTDHVEDALVTDVERLISLERNTCHDANPVDNARLEGKLVTDGERLSLAINTCHDINPVDIVKNDTKDDMANAGAEICVQRKDCEDEGSSKYDCMHLEDLNIVLEESSMKDGAAMCNDTHVLGECSLRGHGVEIEQDIAVKAVREQVLDKNNGNDTHARDRSGGETVEMRTASKMVVQHNDEGIEPVEAMTA